MRLNKRRKQVSSGAPGIEILDTEENHFLRNLAWLAPYINRKKRYEFDGTQIWRLSKKQEEKTI